MCEEGNYFSHIDKDYSFEQLNNFIQNCIITSDIFKQIKQQYNRIDFEHSVSIHIRNGDYISSNTINYFNRMQYIVNTINIIPKQHTEIYVYSDDNTLNYKLYHNILKERFSSVIYVNSESCVHDIIALSLFKYKILWNSTFSYWSGYISNVLYSHSNNKYIICPRKLYSNSIEYECLPNRNWNLIEL